MLGPVYEGECLILQLKRLVSRDFGRLDLQRWQAHSNSVDNKK